MLQVQGILKDPMGIAIPDAIIRITSLDSVGQTVEGSEAEYVTLSDGSYTFSLSYGSVKVEILYDDEFHTIGVAEVTDTIPSPCDIPYLILVGAPSVPPNILETDPDWQSLYDSVVSTGSHRDSLDQLREGDTYSAETKEQWINPTASLAEETTESKTGNASISEVHTAYSDENLNESATTTSKANANGTTAYSSLEAYRASNGKETVKTTQNLQTTKGSISETLTVDDANLSISKSINYQGTTFTELTTGDSNSFLSSISASAGGSTHERKNQHEPNYTNEVGQVVSHERALQEASLKLLETIGQVVHSAEITDTQEVAIDINDLATAMRKIGLKVYDKEAYQKLSIENQESVQRTQVDKYVIQDDQGNELANFDTIGNKLKINGSLEITNADDFKGDTGDSYDYIFQYSSDNGVTDPWESTYETGDAWRRQRQTLNGTEIGTWSEGFYIYAQDGRAGDTFYNQYQYSVDDASKSRGEWHTDYIDGDDWRRWRVIENGLPVSSGHQFYGPNSGWWEERMKGIDGPDGWIPHIQYQYSVDGLDPWSNDFNSTDHYRREKTDWYGNATDFASKTNPVQVGSWSAPAKISPVKGEDYFDGESGTSGAGWYFITGISSSWFLTDSVFNWSGQATNIKNLFNTEFGKDPVHQDVISVSTTDGTKQDTGMYDAALGRFDSVEQLVNGNMIVDGTLKARHIAANAITGDRISSATTIIAGSGSTQAGMNGLDSGIYSGIRFWAGSSTPSNAPYKVKSDGSVVANKISARGSLTAGDYEGGEGVLIDDQGNITSGNYVAGASGYRLDKYGNIDLNEGTFRGTLSGVDGNFEGTVKANKIDGDVVTALLKNVSDIGYTNFNNPFVTVNMFTVTVSASSLKRTLLFSGLEIRFKGADVTSRIQPRFRVSASGLTTVYSSYVDAWSNIISERDTAEQWHSRNVSITIPANWSGTLTVALVVGAHTGGGVEAAARARATSIGSCLLQLFTDGSDLA